ncbi:bifunctional phosphopantothenoylcysteine decarboxylase/phosphopantothenate--cysteine ligase CoaBC, partial [Streptomyces sp. NPDC059853]|uniref:bifunctional phosphopantothenoylcysteine decarboxylase/phosphopantothenate--cysteine ligase CoaBC n=1 Tax=Streptomyces sp. NPDC059853 TaxID=3346973 RepID=UPI003665CFAC
QQADLLVIAPATADLLAKAAHGRADDLLTNTLLTVRAPVVFAPAMHTEMWEHPATRENVATLRRRGAVVIEPASGRLTGADTGKGRLPDPAEIFEICRRVLERGTGALAPDLAGRHVVISAGGTREPLDPVRYLGNRSSGKQGYALARTAVARGARVTLIAANTALPDPAGADVVPVGTARELHDAVVKAATGADVVVMAAAVADFRPAREVTSKIKKRDGAEPEPVALVRNPDILAEVAARGPERPPVVVGFAAETDDVLEGGRAKLARKGCDLLVVNQVGNGRAFGTEENEAVILEAGGPETPVPYGPKEALADRVWDAVARRLTTA